MDTVIYYIVNLLIVMAGSFFVGRTGFPKLESKINDIDNAFLKAISTWAYKFVVECKNTMIDSTGEEKKKKVCENIKALCTKWNIELTDDQISALVEDAYDIMISASKDK